MWIAALLALVQSAAPATFHGRVLQAEDGAPVVRARAEVRWNRGPIHLSRSHGEPRHAIVEPPPWPSAETDDAGRFSIAYDATFDPWIVVEAETRSPGACGLLEGHADVAHELVFALPRAARLEIQLDTAAMPLDHSALARVYEVRAEAALYANSFPAWLGVTSGDTRRTASGTVLEPIVLERLPPGVPIRITFTSDGVHLGRLEDELVLAAGSSRTITWTPPAPSPVPERADATLEIVVRDRDGDPAVGATVSLERVGERVGERSAAARELDPAEEHAVDADGKYARSDVRSGDYVVTIGGAWITKPATVHVDPGSQVVLMTQVSPSRVLRGSVVDAIGVPVAAAWVDFAPRSTRNAWTYGARSNARGAYELRVPRDEIGSVRALHPVVGDLEVVQAEPDVEVLPDGTQRKVDLGAPRELVFPATAKARIHVVDADGRPTPAQIRSGPRAQLGVTWRGAAEALSEPELPLGARTISAVTEDGRAAFGLLDVRAGAEITLRLAPAGIVRLRQRENATPLDVRVETVDGRVYGLTTLIAGVDEVVLVPPGDWSVRAEGRPARPIRLETGVETLVEL